MFESNWTFSAARMVKAGAMALKAVVPGIPKSAKDRELLAATLDGEEGVPDQGRNSETQRRIRRRGGFREPGRTGRRGELG